MYVHESGLRQGAEEEGEGGERGFKDSMKSIDMQKRIREKRGTGMMYIGRQEELGTGRVADRKWRNQVQEGTEMERTGNGTDRKEVDRKWMWNSGQEESEQEIEQSQERDKKWKEKGIE